MTITQITYSNTNCSDLDYYFEATVKKFADFDAIFIGSINQGKYSKLEISNGETKVKVLKVFKGKLKKTETVNFAYFGAWGTRKGEKYLIFAKYDQDGNLYTNENSGSSKIYDRVIRGKMNKSDSLHRETAKITQRSIKFLNKLLTTNNGYIKFYFSNGQIMSEGKWENGFPVELWKHYDKEGKLRNEGFYSSQGKKTGIWKNIYSLKNRHEIINEKYICVRKGFQIEYELYVNGKIIDVKYEIYDASKKLVINKEGKTCENINTKYLYVADIEDKVK